MTEQPRFRFDDSYEKIFQYDVLAGCYLFLGNYRAFGIKKEMSDQVKIDIASFELSMKDYN